MSTRATIHFKYKGDSKAEAIIYRHSDGYPDEPGLGRDLQRFVNDVRANVKDNRFSDASYLAAKWVVWDADNHRKVMAECRARYAKDEPDHICNFLGIGVCRSDPGDIEYRYTVLCDGAPTITCERPDGEPVTIPPLKIEQKEIA